MFSSPPTLLAFAFAPFVLAHGNQGNLTGLQQALYANGLDQFANITSYLNSTPTGQEVLAQLDRGNNTIFAPTDEALSCVAPETLNNETAIANLVAYHVVPGNFVNQTETYPNVTIGRTMLNDSSLVMLEGNKSQVLVWSKYENGTYFVMNQGTNVTVCNSTSYNDTAILAVDSVLTPPPNISTVLYSSPDLSLLSALLNSTRLPDGASALEALNTAHGITLFAPNNQAIRAAQSSLAGLSNNSTALQAVALNHVINGTSVYSTEFIPSNYTSAAGQKLAFASNSTGYYVSAGGSNQAQIVEPNQLASNGVVHIVDGVMLNTNLDPAAASSAYASATAVAAHQTGAAGPVTANSAPATAPTTGTGTHTTTHTNTGTTTGTNPTATTASGGVVKNGVDVWKIGPLVGVVIGLWQFV